MFLKFFNLRKLPITSNASRKIFKYRMNWTNQKSIKQLSLRNKWLSGRNASGHTVLKTRSALTNRSKNIKINYHFRYRKLGFLINFHIIPFTHKVSSLVLFANGALTYFLTTYRQRIFSYWYLNKARILRKLFKKTMFLLLGQVKKLNFISIAEISPGKGAQYIRGPGTKGRILKIDSNTHTALVQLPSGVRKLFSCYSFVCTGSVVSQLNKKCLNSKAGYWRIFGTKPRVRGVAMNPVDHPHGGRTKSIKYPRTPWGKTTKYK